MVVDQHINSQYLPPQPMEIEMFDEKRIEGHLEQQRCLSHI